MTTAVASMPPGNVSQIGNMRNPNQGSQGVQLLFDHSAADTIQGDLRLYFDGGAFDFVQSVFVDNSSNANSLTLSFPHAGPLGFSIVVQPFYQGIFPVTVHPQDGTFQSKTTAGVKIPIVFYNVAMPYIQWGPIVATATFTTPQGTFTNRSGTIAVANTSQQLAAANAARKRIIIENPVSAAGQGIAVAESLYINFTAAAGVDNGTSIELSPGGAFDSGSGPVSTELINVIATTVNHRYIAKEM